MWDDIKVYLVRSCKARECQGIAPSGHFEDEMQATLDALMCSE